ncbi:MAG: sugar ABC transporter permease [Chloroflexi bacterium]|nr:sugar ABC transporter permease [Chloroflexota bacterium]
MLILFVVTIAPSLFLVATSLTPLDLSRPATWWDFRDPLVNYRSLLRDDLFASSVWVQVYLSVATVGFQLLAGLVIAVILNRRTRFLEAVRAIFVIPMVLPPVVVAIIWKVLFTPDVSVINWALGLVHLPQPSWLTDPHLALWTIIIADVWEWFPFTMLMILAALQMMPDEPLEAARIDGAGAWQTFFYVVLPLLRPVIVLAALFRLIESVKAFPLIFIMTSGGPGVTTQPTNYYAYLQGFSYNFIGYSSAISVIVLAFSFLLSWLIIRMAGTRMQLD